MAEAAQAETRPFQTEVRQLLKLMIHSLYSNKEIFLRELVSNASDALDKLRFEALSVPDLLADEPEFGIRLTLDKDAGTLSIADNGIGMSEHDIIDKLGTIAKSGTAEFLSQMSGDANQDARLIGQFGVGFYSAFMVADEVIVESRRAGAAAEEGIRWQSRGEGEFSVETVERAQRGTCVTLHLKPGEREFAETPRIEALIGKYSDHIAFPVTLVSGGDDEPRSVNTATALWIRSRSDIGDDEYKEFYKHLSHDFSDPLLWSHNRVEGKREYTSLLYLPATAPYDLWNRDAASGLKLYVQRVFVMDDAEQFLPRYLRFVKGVVDSSDLPLNVSRELLQQSADLKAMQSALTRRVLDMLKKLSADAERYPGFWKQFGAVLKEGVIEDAANRDRLAKLLRFASTHGAGAEQDQSLDDYLSRAAADQDGIYYLIAENHATALASPQIERLISAGTEVLLLTDRIDPWLVDALREYQGKTLVDASAADVTAPGTGELSQDAFEKEHKGLLKKIRRHLKERVENVTVSQRLVDSPACVVSGSDALTPQLKAMLEATGQALPTSRPVLEINVEHPLVDRLDAQTDDERFAALAEVLLDQALIAEGSQPDNPAEYVARINRLLLESGPSGSSDA